MQQDNFVEEKNEPMPMLCELTTVLQYIVAIAESMALPPSNITFLAIHMLPYETNTYSSYIFQRQHGPSNLLSNLCAGYGVHRNGGVLVDTHTRTARARINLDQDQDQPIRKFNC